jgi:hypothetical protein
MNDRKQQTKESNMQVINVRISSLVLMLAGIFLGGCAKAPKMSETIHDDTAGTNGSFEVAQSGLPVNWLMYTPKTVPNADFDIVLDTAEFKEGKQSLKFVVRACVPTGGWHSPGFCQEYDAKPGETYKVSFWAKNKGSQFIAQVAGVTEFDGQYQTMVQSKETIDTWRLFEQTYTIPPKMKRLRIEVNVVEPGTFWIDDIKIEKVSDQGK